MSKGIKCYPTVESSARVKSGCRLNLNPFVSSLITFDLKDVVLCQINKRTWKDSFLHQRSEERTSAPSGYKRQLGCSKDQEPSLAGLWKQNHGNTCMTQKSQGKQSSDFWKVAGLIVLGSQVFALGERWELFNYNLGEKVCIYWCNIKNKGGLTHLNKWKQLQCLCC